MTSYLNKLKRSHPSTSSESESDSPRRQKYTPNKKAYIFEEGDTMSSMKEKLDSIIAHLDTLATKDDISTIKHEMQTLTQTFVEKVEQLEGRVFEVEAKWDEIETEITSLRKHNEELKNCLKENEKLHKQNLVETNDIQQYTRRWNIRIFKVPEKQNETPAECINKICDIIKDKVKVNVTSEDIEVAHRTGKTDSFHRQRPIIVRFLDRKKRDLLITNRRNLKNQGIVIAEDLTPSNYKIYRQAFKHSACANAWTTNGKIFAKLKNGVSIKLDINTDVNEAFKRVMSNKK